ncbi:MAG: prepilin-type N-terminal cleavage/methylation domain-containing protein [Verrucomicrobiota bacterium]
MRRNGFTLAEVMIATAAFALAIIGLLQFISLGMQMISRNFATNHSHNDTRLAALRLFNDLHNSGSQFTLVNVTGTTYTDVVSTPANPTVVDTLTGLNMSQTTNGVRFYKLLAGPCKLTSTPTAASTVLDFDVPVTFGGLDSNDRLFIPVLGENFTITSVIPARTSTQTLSRKVTLDRKINYNFVAPSATQITTGYFYRPVAYTVMGAQLRFHPYFQGTQKNVFLPIYYNISSPTPFSMLNNDPKKLRISLEANDVKLDKLKLRSGATTYRTVINPLAQDLPIK